MENFSENGVNSIGYKLFSFSGNRAFYPSNSLRSCTANKREVFSDVFVFEKSDKSEFYNLVVLKTGLTKQNWEKYPEEVFFTVGVMSFLKIDVVEIPFNVTHTEFMDQSLLVAQDFGGPFNSPTFIDNPIYSVEVSDKTSINFKVELSSPQINPMLCLIGVQEDTRDIRSVSYNYFERQANSGVYGEGVAELNCFLDPGRYLLIVSIKNHAFRESKMKLYANSLNNELSDHPEVKVNKIGKQFPSYVLNRFDSKRFIDSFSNRNSVIGKWTSDRPHSTQIMQTTRFSEFQRNPGALLTFKGQSEFVLHVQSRNYFKKYQEHQGRMTNPFGSSSSDSLVPPSITLCLLKIKTLDDYEIIVEETDFTSAAWGYWTK